MGSRMSFRSRKVDNKKQLPLLRTSDAPDIELVTPQRSAVQIETGVEKEEEEEHHLQAAISASQAAYTGGKVAPKYIPTPDASKIVEDFSNFYQDNFSQNSSYIRFDDLYDSAVGGSYCLDEIDVNFLKGDTDQALKKQNESRFEEIMRVLEEAANDGRIDPKSENPEVSPDIIATLKAAFPKSRSIEKQVNNTLQHWLTRRKGLCKDDTIMPRIRLDRSLKAENDPYLCFRRREIKLQRRTRATDTFYINKLNQLKSNLKACLQLVDEAYEREEAREKAIKFQDQITKKRVSIFKKRVLAKYDEKIQLVGPSIPERHNGTIQSVHDIGLSNKAPSKSKVRKQDKLKRKREDESCVDLTNNPFQMPPIFQPETLYTSLQSSGNSESLNNETLYRWRRGRGGRMILDRKRLRSDSEPYSYQAGWIGENMPFQTEYDTTVPRTSSNVYMGQETMGFLPSITTYPPQFSALSFPHSLLEGKLAVALAAQNSQQTSGLALQMPIDNFSHNDDQNCNKNI